MNIDNVFDKNGLYSPTKANEELKDSQDIISKFDRVLTAYEAEKLVEAMEKGIIDTEFSIINEKENNNIK